MNYLKYCGYKFFLLGTASCLSPAAQQEDAQPNILIIYADDVGYGDIGVYGSRKIPTPNLDALAQNGIRFTDAYATSAMSTPSRYSLLTGIYAFRLEGAGILTAEAPLLIEPGSLTLPNLLREKGYRTGIVGKWHLGLGQKGEALDWNGPIQPGPLEVGFDRSFLLPVTNDRVPTVYIDQHGVYNLDPADELLQVVYPEEGHHDFQENQFGKETGPLDYKPLVGNLPTGLSHPQLLRYGADVQHSGTIVNGISRIGHMAGGQSAWWDDEQMTFVFAEKAKDFIGQNPDGKPFFLLLSMHQNHVPRIPNPRFLNSSQVGLRGDCVVELDWMVGEIVQYLRETNQLHNTLILFSSDNGPVLFDGYDDGALENHNWHDPNGGLRGGKYIAYEGGTRVPAIISWPAGIRPGKVSQALISQVDWLASFASLVGYSIDPDLDLDSENHLPALLGKDDKGRDYIVQQSSDGLGIRKENWKFIEASPRSAWAYNRHNQGGESFMHIQPLKNTGYLFNLLEDPREENNLAGQHPEKVKQMSDLLQSIKDEFKVQ